MWKREFRWINTSELFDFENIGKNEAVVLIGDQCFEFEDRFKYKIDLAEEWKKQTGLPFVFACWVSNRELDNKFIADFNSALKSGIDNIGKVAKAYAGTGLKSEADLKEYLTKNIDYIFDNEKKKGMALFLKLLKDL